MADIIHLRDDPHQSTQILLPWYVSGRLEADDAALVETHLGGCGECRRALENERLLKTAINRLPLNPDIGWGKLQRRLVRRAPLRRDAPMGRPRPWRTVGWPVALTAFAGAQLAVLALAISLLLPAPPSADYHTLGASPARSDGNILILFRPDAKEEEIRFVLARAGATMVGGPTAAGGYVLGVDPSRRDAALAELRAQPSILLAHPIEPGPTR